MYVLDLDQLRTFVAIAEMGSFTAAAEVVHKTQSAVSMQMRRLEERVGKPIFVRDGRQSRLTEDGRRLLDYGQRLIRLNDETLMAFADPGIAGKVRLGIPDDYADRLLPTVLAGFSRINPSIEVEVECQPSEIVNQMIRDERLDIGIVTVCQSEAPDAVTIRREPLFWVGSRDHNVHEIDPLPLALGSMTCQWRAEAIRGLDRINRRFRIAYTSQAAAALSGAITAGLAISILPESALRPTMRILGAREGLPPLPPCEIAIVRAEHATNPVHDALCNHIVTSLGNLSQMSIAAE
jgi:DNA-binding transcriptional LysR family regulator